MLSVIQPLGVWSARGDLGYVPQALTQVTPILCMILNCVRNTPCASGLLHALYVFTQLVLPAREPDKLSRSGGF